MKTVIEKYKKFTFIYVIINCFAFLVNITNVKSYFTTGKSIFYYFTVVDNKVGLYPFVSFLEFPEPGYYDTYFRGIFYQYGVAEFLLYMGILIGFLVYKAYIATPVKVKPQV